MYKYFLIVLWAFILFFWSIAIINLNAVKECLQLGYPKATTTYKYESFCIGLDGNTQTKLFKLE